MSTTTQITPDWTPDPQWPITAIPQRWVEALFDAMSANYGTRFADLWRGTDLAKVKRHWGAELAKLSREQLKAGVEHLGALAKAPTVPEFLAHCRQVRLDVASMQRPKLSDRRPCSPEIVESNMSRIRSIVGGLSARKAMR
ncbi:hypothetical protein C7405_101668 [Paraburkholderia caballeronis]|uniref:hypothetical protein n=1 Tax=Paraburkholderia caballeronis TaxID=416943 RepID=UPI001066F1C6|nr:hypothetical protein [Paraburkholderia caballeronis]TDV39549.1 hypothetical protein C7405_101668 [Paraburkholderia caballeronis]